MNVDEVAANSDLGDLPRAIGLEVEHCVSARSCALHVTLEYFKTSNSNYKLVSLSRTAVYDQYRLVCVLMPREYFGGGVDERRASNVVIAHMRLGIPTVQCERDITHLRNSDVPKR